MDEGSREILFYCANDLNLGIGMAIVICSITVKLLYAPIMIYTQINAIKMKLLEPETKNFQATSKKL